jgi:hypothetical protein
MRVGHSNDSITPFSWWSWRPGIKPLHALLLGGIAILPGLAIASFGVLTLVSTPRSTFASLLLLTFGLLLLGYPLQLARWGLRDLLIARYTPHDLCQLTNYVVATRAVEGSTRQARPGMMPRGTHAWHGIAVLLPNDTTTSQRVLTLSVDASLFPAAREGTLVRIIYSPYVHYVYSLERIDEQA